MLFGRLSKDAAFLQRYVGITSAMAEQLFCSLIAAVPQGSAVFIDIPEPNKNVFRLLSLIDMQPVFETGRMYNKGLPGKVS